MRLVFSGTRRGVDPGTLREHIVKLKPSVVLHGACRGADEQVEAVCQELGIPTERYPAEWEKHGRSAGPIRNKAMLRKGDQLLAMPCTHSRGTTGTIKLAMGMGMPITVAKQ